MSIMKKILCMMAAALVMVSCTNEEQVANPKGNHTLKLSFASINQDSRMAMSTADNTLTWKVGDKLQVWETENPPYYVFNLTSGEGTADGTFELEGQDGPESFYGMFYPCDWGREHWGDVMYFEIPHVLDQTEEGNVDIPMWMFGGWYDSEEPQNNKMDHIGAVLKITLTNIPEGYNRMILESEDQLSGRFSFITNASPNMGGAVDPDNDDADYIAVSKTIKVDFTAATASDNDAVLYVPIAPQPHYDLDHGSYYDYIKVSISNGTDTRLVKTFEDKTIKLAELAQTTIDCTP